MGAWIEIYWLVNRYSNILVAPLVGAWIEICVKAVFHVVSKYVAPLVGAWIEMEQ